MDSFKEQDEELQSIERENAAAVEKAERINNETHGE